MSIRKFTTRELTSYDLPNDADISLTQSISFIIELSKDWNVARASRVAGITTERGLMVREHPEVKRAIGAIQEHRLENSHITAEWALMEAVDNHLIARQMNNINASNTALNLIMKHSTVDAFAAEKVTLSVGEEVKSRLARGRQRMNQSLKPDSTPNPVDFG